MPEWSLWLDEHLLAPVPHRQVVLTLPKRLRAYFLHDRRRLGLLSQVDARILRDYVQAAIGDYAAVPGAARGRRAPPRGRERRGRRLRRANLSWSRASGWA